MPTVALFAAVVCRLALWLRLTNDAARKFVYADRQIALVNEHFATEILSAVKSVTRINHGPLRSGVLLQMKEDAIAVHMPLVDSHKIFLPPLRIKLAMDS